MHTDLDLIILLVVKNLTERWLSMSKIYSVIYFLSRRLEIDLEYKYCYYTMHSEKVDISIRRLMASNMINKFRYHRFKAHGYKLSQDGEDYILNCDEREVAYLNTFIEKISCGAIYVNEDRIAMAYILDKIYSLYGKDMDVYLTVKYMNILGWFPTPERFKQLHNAVCNIRIKYPKNLKGY